MDGLEKVPEKCREPVKRLVKRFGISCDAAYNLIRLEALLWDLQIDDPDIERMILRNAGCKRVRVRV